MKFFPKKVLWISFLLIFSALILWPGLKGPLVYDDYYNLSPLMKDDANYKLAILENNAGPFGRELTMLTFVVNHWARDGLFIFDLKLTNLIIHLFNALLVYYLVFYLLKIKFSINKASVYAIAVMGFWVLNPINTAVIFYVIQRGTLLATTFMLISCIAYVRMRLFYTKFSIEALGLILCCFVSWVLAVISKENAVLLPLIILCLEVCFFNYLDINRIGNKKSVLFLLVFGILSLLTCFLLKNYGFFDYSKKDFSIYERLYTQPVVLFVYLKEILVPQVVDVSLWNDDFKIRKTFWNASTVYSFVFISILVFASLINLRNAKYKYIGAGVLIFFSGHLLESSIFPLELFFRHRNYFPSVGIFLTLLLIIDRSIASNNARKLLFITCVMYFVLLGHHSFRQANVWASYDSILVNAYKNHPESLGVNLEIVGKLVQKKDLLSSLSINNVIITERPTHSLPAKIQRFYIYCELATNIPEQEYKILEKDLNLLNELLVSSSLYNFVQSYTNRRCDFIDIRRIINSFISWSTRQLLLDTESSLGLWNIDYYLIELLLLLGDKEEAMVHLERHISYGNPKALYFKENAFQ